MSQVIVYGAPYSVYVRIVRLALEEKGVPYRLQEVDIFADEGPPAEHVARHPFAKIPAFAHGDFQLYETGAITRYVDAAFDGPPLVPEDPRTRARMDQIIGLLDSYGYRAMVWDVFVERVRRPEEGAQPDENRIRSGLDTARRCLTALSDLKGAHAFLAGRAYVTPQDIKTIRPDVLRHRVIISYEAEAEELTSDDIVKRVFDGVKVP